MVMYAFVIKIPFYSNLSAMTPLIIVDIKPNTETTKALLMAYVVNKSLLCYDSSLNQRSLKNFGMKNAIVKPPKNRKKPPMDTHLHVGFWKISFKAARNFYKVDFYGPEDA